jgi:DNA polymerase-4
MPLKALKSHFGASGEVLQRFASGIDDREVEPPAAAKSTSRETTFGQDARDPARLESTLRYLGERVGADLRHKGKRARCVTLKLRYGDFTTITRRQTLSQSTDSDQTIFETGKGLLKKALSGESQAVRLIGIGVSELVETGRQLDMMDGSAQRQEQLTKAIDRIRKN